MNISVSLDKEKQKCMCYLHSIKMENDYIFEGGVEQRTVISRVKYIEKYCKKKTEPILKQITESCCKYHQLALFDSW